MVMMSLTKIGNMTELIPLTRENNVVNFETQCLSYHQTSRKRSSIESWKLSTIQERTHLEVQI